MADLRLLEFVLLRTSFEARTATEWPIATDIAHGSPYPPDDVLELKASAERRDDAFLLRLDATLADDRLPFELTVSAGARFIVVDAPELTAERAQSTLVFMAFPYLREMVWNLTGRSSYPPYALPPLTRLPDAPVRGDEPELIRRPPPNQPAQEPSDEDLELVVEADDGQPTSDNGDEPPSGEQVEPA